MATVPLFTLVFAVANGQERRTTPGVMGGLLAVAGQELSSLIGRWTASATAYWLSLTPVVAVTLGAILADEPIAPEVVIGVAVLAVYMGAIRRRSDRKVTTAT